MKISLNWLRELAQLELSVADEKIIDQLTMLGLEVDEVAAAAFNFSGVVIGEIIDAKQHPDADRLRVCTVNIGQNDNLNIVCGAQNARAGIKVVVATVGAVLPNNLKIKRAKLRGVESFGMICSLSELGLAETSEGILELPNDALVGTNIQDYLLLNDKIITIELTPNRGDCLSAFGLARELAALNKTSLKNLDIVFTNNADFTFSVQVEAKDFCPHYVGCVIKNINTSAKTPLWMTEKLRRSGLRSINPVVDVTNYVMLELGQPLHAFDLTKIDSSIVVRLAKNGEELTLLDGKKVQLDVNTLVIADKSKLLALAGIMGGNDSAVDSTTKDIFLESAYFAFEKMRGLARRFGLQTDSSYRFERGVDYQLQIKAIQRTVSLLSTIVGGELGALIEIKYEKSLPVEKQIKLNLLKLAKLLGENIESSVITDIFTRLGFKINSFADENNICEITVPSFRFDINIEEDLIEEIARVYGYDKILPREIFSKLESKQLQLNQLTNLQTHAREILVNAGFYEAITFSFIDPKLQNIFNPDIEPLSLANPISPELSVMRTSLLPGLIKAVAYNVSHKMQRVRLFEIGLCFIDRDQIPFLAAIATGDVLPLQWEQQKKSVDYFSLKNDLLNLLKNFGSLNEFVFKAEEHPALHPKRSARIYWQKIPLGWIGELHPFVKKDLDLNIPICVFELNLSLLKSEKKSIFNVFSKFPTVERDLSIVIDKKVHWDDIRDKILLSVDNILQNIQIFDIFTSSEMDVNQKSIALHLIFQHLSRTLVEDEVERAMQSIISVLQSDFNAKLR